MKIKKWIVLSVAGCAAAVLASWAIIIVPTKTFRTTAFLRGLQQGTDAASQLPEYAPVPLPGWKLVNLARGRAITDRSVSNEVLAMTFHCDLTAASLVVYDKTASNVVATIAASDSMNTLTQDTALRSGKTNHTARFVASLPVTSGGTSSNGLVSGYLTVAGRVHLDATGGCPKPVLVALDRDPNDRQFGDNDVSSRFDPDELKKYPLTGRGHLIGVIELVSGGVTNTVLVPHGDFSIRRDLPVPLL